MRCSNKTLYSPRTPVTSMGGHEESNDCILLIPGIRVRRWPLVHLAVDKEVLNESPRTWNTREGNVLP